MDGLEHPDFFGIVSLDGRIAVPVGPRFSLVPQGMLRFLFGDDIPILYANVLGGDMAGRYVDQQIPFNSAAYRSNCLFMLRSDLRYELLPDNYLTATVNYARDFFDFDNFESGTDTFGFGLGYAYNSIVGPLKANIHWSTLTR